ncbi:MAG: hypothetical protein ACLFU7_14985 [Armatimonadota bacterium]
MAYDDLLREGRIRRHRAEPDDIAASLTLANARLGDAALSNISNDGRFVFAYDAVRSAAEAVMATEGYRPASGIGHHETVFRFLLVAADGRWRKMAMEFEQARSKRNAAEYDEWGLVTETEANRLLEVARQFVREVSEWVAGPGGEQASRIEDE